MNILEIIQLLFTKIGDVTAINNFFNLLLKIPKSLKNILCFVIIVGLIYFGYSKLYTYNIQSLLSEVTELKTTLSTSVKKDVYSSDVFYIINALTICQLLNKYSYEEEQLQLKLIEQYIKRLHPDDPIIVDIEAMIERNKFNFEHYDSEFNRALSNCKTNTKEETTDSIRNN